MSTATTFADAVMKHLPGQHDQSSHGRRGTAAGAAVPSDTEVEAEARTILDRLFRAPTFKRLAQEWVDQYGAQADVDEVAAALRDQVKVDTHDALGRDMNNWFANPYHHEGHGERVSANFDSSLRIHINPNEVAFWAGGMGHYGHDWRTELQNIMVHEVAHLADDLHSARFHEAAVALAAETETPLKGWAHSIVQKHYPGGRDHDQSRHGHRTATSAAEQPWLSDDGITREAQMLHADTMEYQRNRLADGDEHAPFAVDWPTEYTPVEGAPGQDKDAWKTSNGMGLFAEEVPMNALIHMHGNVPRHSEERIAELTRSLAENGAQEEAMLYLGTDDHVYIGEGNHRIEAARRLGWTHFPCRLIVQARRKGAGGVGGDMLTHKWRTKNAPAREYVEYAPPSMFLDLPGIKRRDDVSFDEYGNPERIGKAMLSRFADAMFAAIAKGKWAPGPNAGWRRLDETPPTRGDLPMCQPPRYQDFKGDGPASGEVLDRAIAEELPGEGADTPTESLETGGMEALGAEWGPDYKALVQDRLYKRLEQDKDFRSLVSARTGIPLDQISPDDLKGEVRSLVDTWAKTAGDSNVDALLVQEAARQEFNLTGARVKTIAPDADLSVPSPAAVGWNEQKYGVYQRHLKSPEFAGYRAFVRAQYDETQDLLKRKGIDEVLVFRGGGVPADTVPSGDDEAWSAGYVHVRQNPLTSWSTSATVASDFQVDGSLNQDPAIFATVVPRERILSTPATGNGCLREAEVVILGGETPAFMIAGPDAAWHNFDEVLADYDAGTLDRSELTPSKITEGAGND